jgi:hypothetical protein
VAKPGRGALRAHHPPAIRRGSFENVTELIATIRAFIDGWNDRCHPFTWTKTADEILPHAIRERDSDAGHQPG